MDSFQTNQLRNYKAFWLSTPMDMRTSSTSFLSLYTAEGRKLKSFFMRYWLHPHVKAATVIAVCQSFYKRPYLGRTYRILAAFNSQRVDFKAWISVPENSFHLHITHKAKPFLGSLTINNFTEVIIKIIVYFIQKICILFKSDNYEDQIHIQPR